MSHAESLDHQVLYRDAHVADLDGIFAILDQQIRESVNTFRLQPLDEAAKEQWWQTHQEERYPALVAVRQAAVLGWASLAPFGGYEAYAATAEVSIWIGDGNRCRGIGGRLYRQLLARADEIGFHTLIARIEAGNEASLRLHRRCGFQQCGYLKEVGEKCGRRLDVVLMQRMCGG